MIVVFIEKKKPEVKPGSFFSIQKKLKIYP